MVRRLKLYGERNTNTNYLSKLIALNLAVEQMPGSVPPFVQTLQRRLPGSEFVRDTYFSLSFGLNLGWKHTRVSSWSELQKQRTVNAELGFVTITKNPYSWLLSLHRRPHHQFYGREKPSFEAFLQREWQTIRRDNVGKRKVTPIDLWNQKNRSYFNLPDMSALHLTSEMFFADVAAVVDTIGRKFNISRISPDFIDYDRSTKDASKTGNYYRDYYQNERWRAELSAEAVTIINQLVDQDLMQHFGYALLDPSSV